MELKTEKKHTGILRKDLELFPGEMDEKGQNTWLIFDPVADKYFKISEKEYHIISQFNSDKPIEKVSEILSNAGIGVSSKEVVAISLFLTQNNLLLPVYSNTENRLTMFRNLKRKMLPSRILSSYLFIKIPLLKPDPFLSRTIPFIKTVFNKWMILFLTLISLAGYMQLVVRWDKVAATVLSSFTLAGMIRYVITIIILKLFHEFAHAYAAKSLGIRVRRMGVSFIVFFPRLYTDVTDLWRIPDRKKRVFIDIAGIACEVLIGGFAALIWANTGPGLANAIAYYVFAVTIINTIFINGNPFIRYDGYYLLMDLTGVDNLQSKGIRTSVAFMRKYLLGIDDLSENKNEGWRSRFLIFYGFSAFIYRIFLYTSIILIVYHKFTKTIGIILMILEVYLLILKPLIKEVRTVIGLKSLIKKTNFAVSMLSLCSILLILIIPLPWNISMPGEIKAEECYVVRALNNGFLTKICTDNHINVEKGTILLQQENPFLEWEEKIGSDELKLAELELDQLQGASETIAYSRIKKQQKDALKDALNDIRRKKTLLSISAPASGYFLSYNQEPQEGKWLTKGEIIGELYKPEKQLIYAYAEEKDIKRVESGDNVKFRINGEVSRFGGSIVSVSFVPNRRLLSPSPLLSSFGGPLKIMSQGDLFELEQPYYKIVIKPLSATTIPVGRTGTVQIRKYSSVAANLFRKAFNTYREEFTF